MGARNVARELFSIDSDRDKQRLAGPSDLADACDVCLARKLSGEASADAPSAWPMGAKIGTSIHGYLEDATIRHMPYAMSERNWYIGTIEGYGDIRGTADHFIPETGQLSDFKTTLKKKVPALKAAYDKPAPVAGEPLTHQEARYKLRGYVAQGSMYALGLELAGYEVTSIALNFIPRDASSYDDIFVLEYEYDKDFALAALDRARYMWEHLTEEQWTSQAFCFACSTR